MKPTLLVPAAGRGQRLGYPLPKILYPVDGKPVLAYLLARFSTMIGDCVLITSPEGRGPIEENIRDLMPEFPVKYVVQPEPLGMVDAILRGSKDLPDGEPVLIACGNQVLLSYDTIFDAIRTYGTGHGARAVLPTLQVTHPETHFIRDDQGKLTGCLLRRERDLMPELGESDCGFYVVASQLLKKELVDYEGDLRFRGKETGEAVFPPFFVYLTELGVHVKSSAAYSVGETIALNTPHDAHRIESHLKA